MGYIDWTRPSRSSFGNAGRGCEAARRTVEARLAQAAESDARLDRGWLIIPTLIALGVGGWLMPMIALGYALAPLAAVGFLLWDKYAPATATDHYHGL